MALKWVDRKKQKLSLDRLLKDCVLLVHSINESGDVRTSMSVFEHGDCIHFELDVSDYSLTSFAKVVDKHKLPVYYVTAQESLKIGVHNLANRYHWLGHEASVSNRLSRYYSYFKNIVG